MFVVIGVPNPVFAGVWVPNPVLAAGSAPNPLVGIVEPNEVVFADGIRSETAAEVPQELLVAPKFIPFAGFGSILLVVEGGVPNDPKPVAGSTFAAKD